MSGPGLSAGRSGLLRDHLHAHMGSSPGQTCPWKAQRERGRHVPGPDLPTHFCRAENPLSRAPSTGDAQGKPFSACSQSFSALDCQISAPSRTSQPTTRTRNARLQHRGQAWRLRLENRTRDTHPSIPYALLLPLDWPKYPQKKPRLDDTKQTQTFAYSNPIIPVSPPATTNKSVYHSRNDFLGPSGAPAGRAPFPNRPSDRISHIPYPIKNQE